MNSLPSVVVLFVPAFLVALAMGLLAHLALVWTSGVAVAIGKRLGRRSLVFSRQHGADVQIGQQQISLSWMALLPLVGGCGLALLWLHPLLSLWAVFLGLTGTWIMYSTRASGKTQLRAEQEVFLNALRGRYAVSQSLTAALAGAAGDLENPDSPLVQAALEAVRRLRASQSPEQALTPLIDLSPIMRRLVTVLSRAELTAAQETKTILEELETQAIRTRRLADRARVTLVTVRLTLRVLVVANVVGATLSTMIPIWRSYYCSHPATYIAGTGLAMAGFAYFSFKIKALEDLL